MVNTTSPLIVQRSAPPGFRNSCALADQTPLGVVSIRERMFEELFAGRLVRVGLLRCEPAEPVWHGLEASDAGALITFPLTSVVVEPDGGEAVLANPNHAIGSRARDSSAART